MGAQLAEFTNGVPAGVRGAIADSILLAQLAAIKPPLNRRMYSAPTTNTSKVQRTITQVLFFKFSEQSAEVKKAAGKMAVGVERMSSAKDLIANPARLSSPILTRRIAPSSDRA
jgi:hypothetical protein